MAKKKKMTKGKKLPSVKTLRGTGNDPVHPQTLT